MLFLLSRICSTNSADLLDAVPDLMKGFKTADDCCFTFFGYACTTVDDCAGETVSTVLPTTTEKTTTIPAATTQAETTQAPSEPMTTQEPETTTTIVATEAASKWWYDNSPSNPNFGLGLGTCTFSSTYPPLYPAEYMYDSKDECCDNHNDIGCLTMMPSKSPTAKPTLPPLPPLPEVTEPEWDPKWYPSHSTDGSYLNTCVYGNDYPLWMSGGVNAAAYLFDSEEVCCDEFGCGTTADAKWYPHIEEGHIKCKLDVKYEDGVTVYGSEEECCSASGCGGETTSTVAATTSTVPATTTEEPTTTSTASTTTQAVTTTTTAQAGSTNLDDYPFVEFTAGFDSFDDAAHGEKVPWINSGQWEIDNTFSLLHTSSMKSIKPVGEGASSDLSLKLKLAGWTMLKCQAYVDVSMPHEMFEMSIDGQTRHMNFAPSGGWVEILTGIPPGEHTVQFQVKNADVAPEIPRTIGTGQVWLDICDFAPV